MNMVTLQTGLISSVNHGLRDFAAIEWLGL